MAGVDSADSATVAPGTSVGPDETCTFLSTDGTQLYGEWFEPTAPLRGGALILHGYAEHCGRYHEVARVLTARGLATLSFDFRGHGRSAGERGYCEHFDDYLRDAEAGFGELYGRLCERSEGKPLPVVLVAHSNGGLLALRWLSDPTREVEAIVGAVITSPFLALKLDINPLKRGLAHVTSAIVPKLAMANQLVVEHLTSDPDKQAARKADSLCNDVATSRWFTEAMRTQQVVADTIVRLRVPTLWVVAGRDRIADPEQSRLVHDRVRAPSAYHEMPQMEHEVLNEVDRDRVFELVRAFLDERFPS